MTNSNLTVDRQFRLARHWSNRELQKVAPLFAGNIVNVSAGENIDKEGSTYDQYFPNKSSFSLTNYAPGDFRGFEGRQNEYLVDLSQELPAELEARFDVALNHTVLEHVFDVQKAFRNLSRLSKDIVIVVVPFAQVQHDSPGYEDYWRLCPAGLRYLFQENGLEVIYEAGNSNVNAAVYLFFVGSRHPERWRDKMPAYQPVTNAGDWIGYVPPPPVSRLDRLKLKICRWLMGNDVTFITNRQTT